MPCPCSLPSSLIKAILVAGACAALLGCGKEAPPAPKPAEVVAVTVEPRTVPVTVPFVAQTVSSHEVEIATRVSGFLDKIAYTEGQVVRAGQVLFQIDPKPFQAQLDSSKAEVEARKAQVWTAKATLDRLRPLAEANAASKSDLDIAIGNHQAAEAALAEAEARLRKNELDLGYTTITSPITGVTGRSLYREGTYLSFAGPSAKMTYVARLDPMWVEFSLSQNEFAQLRAAVAAGQLTAPDGKDFTLTLKLSDGKDYPHAGRLNFADPSYSKETGTFLIRATVPNPDGALRPGMFVKAFLGGMTRPNALTVPQKAVQQTSNGHVVFVVDEQGLATVRPVVVGDWVGHDWVITTGLKAGERVIVEGFQRVAPGAPVKLISAEEAAAAAAAPAGK